MHSSFEFLIYRKLGVVTSAFHMPRSEAIFRHCAKLAAARQRPEHRYMSLLCCICFRLLVNSNRFAILQVQSCMSAVKQLDLLQLCGAECRMHTLVYFTSFDLLSKWVIVLSPTNSTANGGYCGLADLDWTSMPALMRVSLSLMFWLQGSSVSMSHCRWVKQLCTTCLCAVWFL